ncbi:hypothetical protein E2C01_018667 [Portunus trituberculatus]|uniref:Uncharacterized protein n=1 Tax=Portunus trituberculatus TaxID=210409 RepID=A0A5B7DVU6_PORTR|nr:hypothetical protein [Portunus trituberculatus]
MACVGRHVERVTVAVSVAVQARPRRRPCLVVSAEESCPGPGLSIRCLAGPACPTGTRPPRPPHLPASPCPVMYPRFPVMFEDKGVAWRGGVGRGGVARRGGAGMLIVAGVLVLP